MAVTITEAAQTDIGCVRKQNQDSFGMDPDRHLYVVCDGMGGAAGGEVASQLAVDAFLRTFAETPANTTEPTAPQDALFHAGLAANTAVRTRAVADSKLRGMGSTLVAAHIAGPRLLLINVGDSRAYLLRDHTLSQLTVDHSYLDEQVRLGIITQAMADASSLQSVITRAVGIDDNVQPDLYGVDLEDGDLILLTSDGLTRHVTDTELTQLIDGNSLLAARCNHLVELARERGGSDNITCILLHVALNEQPA